MTEELRLSIRRQLEERYAELVREGKLPPCEGDPFEHYDLDTPEAWATLATLLGGECVVVFDWPGNNLCST